MKQSMDKLTKEQRQARRAVQILQTVRDAVNSQGRIRHYYKKDDRCCPIGYMAEMCKVTIPEGFNGDRIETIPSVSQALYERTGLTVDDLQYLQTENDHDLGNGSLDKCFADLIEKYKEAIE